MKKISKLTIACLSCIPALSFAFACPDASTIQIINKKVFYNSTFYEVKMSFPIQFDRNPTFNDAILSTTPIDNATVKLGKLSCGYRVGTRMADGGFYLVTRQPLNMNTSDKALSQAGWFTDSYRQHFFCVGIQGRSCDY